MSYVIPLAITLLSVWFEVDKYRVELAAATEFLTFAVSSNKIGVSCGSFTSSSPAIQEDPLSIRGTSPQESLVHINSGQDGFFGSVI